MKVPYMSLAVTDQELKKDMLQAMDNVMTSGQFILGPQVAEFEKKFAEIAGTKHAVSVDNGTSSLVLILRALGIGPGDEVITVPNSFVASASCIALAGATPVFTDVGEDMNMDASLLEKVITKKTKAVIPVHWMGLPADMNAIHAVCGEIPVIEDAAQAVGALYKGKPAGSLGKAASFSLHPLKNLSALGDGGVITTDDDAIAEYAKLARNHGLKSRNEVVFFSPNHRLDTLQAAVLLAKLPRLKAWNDRRRDHAAFYRKELEGLVILPAESAGTESVYHTFIIRTPKRDALKEFLQERGVETAVHYPIPLHLQEAAKYLGYTKGDFPVAEQQANEILSLPVYPALTDQQRTAVTDGIKAFFQA